jgi:RHS repeat-associated protein
VGQLKLGTGETFFFRRDPGGQLLSRKKRSDGARHYYVTDALWSVSMMTDTAGSWANLYEYEPYGAVKSQSIPLTNPFKFAAGHDTGQGGYHFGARQYDPGLGRWAQIDPVDQIGDLTEANRYGYVAGDPVNEVDHTGLQAACSKKRRKGLGGTPGSGCAEAGGPARGRDGGSGAGESDTFALCTAGGVAEFFSRTIGVASFVGRTIYGAGDLR